MPPISHPICVPCGKVMHCHKNGVVVQINHPDAQVKADIYKCPDCGYEITIGYSGDWLLRTVPNPDVVAYD